MGVLEVSVRLMGHVNRYDLPGFGWLKAPARNHDLHHEKFECYYSPLSILDWVHGTDLKGMEERRRRKREEREKMAEKEGKEVNGAVGTVEK